MYKNLKITSKNLTGRLKFGNSAYQNLENSRLLQTCSGEFEYLVLYVDTYRGQNRNQTEFSALLYALNAIGKLDVTDYKFLEGDHIFLEPEWIRENIERTRKHRTNKKT